MPKSQQSEGQADPVHEDLGEDCPPVVTAAGVLESITDAFIRYNPDWTVAYLNSRAAALLRRSREELLGKNIWEEFPESVGGAFHQTYLRSVRENRHEVIREYAPRYDIWLEGHCYPDQNGLSVYLSDITARMRTEEALRQSEHRFQRIAANVPGMIFQFLLRPDGSSLFPYVSEGCREIYGVEPDAILQNPAVITDPIHPDDVASLWDAIAESAGSLTPFRWEGRTRHRTGKEIWVLGASIPERLPNGDILWDGLLMDITARKEAEAQLQLQIEASRKAQEELERQRAELLLANQRLQEYSIQLEAQRTELARSNTHLEAQATTDGLTRLKNHRAFQKRLTEVYQQSEALYSLVLLDVDHFKLYNDEFGHPEGDAVLRQVAEILQSKVREGDFVARYGGEEFAVILPGADQKRARMIAERLRQGIEQASWSKRNITVSLGIATRTEQALSSEALVAEADKALYRSKQRGRNCTTHAADPPYSAEFTQTVVSIYKNLMQQVADTHADALFSSQYLIQERVQETCDAATESWSHLLNLRDGETVEHSERIMQLMIQLARSIGMNEEEVLYVRWGALLHDIGKIGVPDAILTKPGPLTEEEWEVMRRHPKIAYEMLSTLPFLRPALDIPYCHHERWDGTGYPRGLAGEEIPLSARLFAVVDVYDSLCSDRPYRKRWSKQEALRYLEEQSGAHFDPRAVRAFLNLLQSEEVDLKAA